MDRYYPAAPSPAPAPYAGFVSRVTPYLGTYYSARGNFTTFEKLMGGMPPYNLSLDARNNLILSVAGSTLQLVEVQPGLLRDPNNANVQLVLHTDEAGQAYILSSEPWAYIKVPWYGTTDFRDLLVEIALLLSVASLMVWSSAALMGLGNRLRNRLRKSDQGDKGEPAPQPKTRPFLPRLARGVAGLFGPLLIVLFVGMDFLLKSKDPVVGYPVVLMDKPLTFYILMVLPYILAGLGVLMLVFAVLAWIRRYWTLVGRLHYTLLALSGLSVLWGVWYWNLLF
jgi:hypothetical protein